MILSLVLYLANIAVVVARSSRSITDCTNIELPPFDEFDVLSVAAVTHSFDIQGTRSDVCNLTIISTHPGSKVQDYVYNYIWLPLERWNGRLVVIGGGELSTSELRPGYSQLDAMIADGFATAATEGGLSLNNTINAYKGEWVLDKANNVNWDLFKNFVHRAVHDIATISKSAVETLYDEPPKYSYFSGCSTGGRQGYDSADHHPDDFDGIAAGAPAIYAPQLVASDLWPQVVMQSTVAPPQCVFTTYFEAILDACDKLDNVHDGIISRPDLCKFDAHSLEGKQIECPDTRDRVIITREWATVIDKTLKGPRARTGEVFGYGLPPGAVFQVIANTVTRGGKTRPVPLALAAPYLNGFLQENIDVNNISYDRFENIYKASMYSFSSQLAGESTNLYKFYSKGKKLLSFHGLNDPIISHESTIRFWHQIHDEYEDKIDDFYRLFLYGGGGHCGMNIASGSGAYGLLLENPIWALVEWVENDEGPKTMMTSKTFKETTFRREACPYPNRVEYQGEGDISLADSYHCV